MLNVIIIEDEKAAMELLVQKLSEIAAEVNVSARLNSVKQSIEYFDSHAEADIIFSDVQLSDGLSFDIFTQKSIQSPVIFITGYEDYMMMAFENNGIDYLLKPVDTNDLKKAIIKYNRLQEHFSHANNNAPAGNLMRFINQRKKTRLLVRKGLENIALRLEDIAFIYTQNKVVYVIDSCSKKYLSDKTLSELEAALDENIFFRVNRQYIVNINYVKSFKTFEKVKLLLDINVPDTNHSIVISQETAPAFRKWMHEA
ncbi:MAG TPA: LytTR family DNA-binding domain-containing protein [Chitinophagaceae bacterium]|nr:LytTR family DNA-binding domain-containing protein [Chitinophagaceae bacterium]